MVSSKFAVRSILIAFVLMLTGAAPALAGSAILGTTGDNPRAIVVDSAGNVYTANSSANNVSKITPSGFSTILDVTGVNPYPGAIAID